MVKGDSAATTTTGTPLVLKTSVPNKVVNTSILHTKPATPHIVRPQNLMPAVPRASQPRAPKYQIIRPQQQQPQTVVLVDKDGKRSTVTVDGQTLEAAQVSTFTVLLLRYIYHVCFL